MSIMCSLQFLNNDLLPVILSDLTGKLATLPIIQEVILDVVCFHWSCVRDLQPRCSPHCTSSPGRWSWSWAPGPGRSGHLQHNTRGYNDWAIEYWGPLSMNHYLWFVPAGGGRCISSYSLKTLPSVVKRTRPAGPFFITRSYIQDFEINENVPSSIQIS